MVVYDSTLITPTTGLMIWTLVTFVVGSIYLKESHTLKIWDEVGGR